MNHRPIRRHRRTIVASSIAGLLLAAACGDGQPRIQTDVAPAAPESAQGELADLEDNYRAAASEYTPQANPFEFNVEERTCPPSSDDADHRSPNQPFDQPTRPASGPRPY
jgi:hypothetical protein